MASTSEGNNNSSEDGASGSSQDGQGPSAPPDPRFECNICLDQARDAVISMCGHLFCWPCLHQWLETRPTRQVCPVCKSAISRDKVIPLYGRDSKDQTDPRDKVPPRPQGQRSEPASGGGFGFGGFDWGGGGAGAAGVNNGGFQMSFGIGAFPFQFFASTFNFGEERPPAAAPGTRQYDEEQFLSKVFLWVAVVFILWLLLA